MAVETLRTSGTEKFAPEKKAGKTALLTGIVGTGAEVLLLGTVKWGILFGIGAGLVTWYQARFGSRRSP